MRSMAKKSKLKKGDLVEVIAGKNYSVERARKRGNILKIDNGRVIVEGVNLVKKSKKPTQENQQGGIVDIEAPLDISNVMIVCKKCGPTRIGIQISESGKKTRICRKCKEEL